MSNVIHASSEHMKIANGSVYVRHSATKGKPGMIMFHAKWCGHCTRFMPTLNKLSMSLGSEYPCVAIEADQLQSNESVTTALKIEGFPTIKFFDQYGRIVGDYMGDRSESDILSHICKIYHHCIMHH